MGSWLRRQFAGPQAGPPPERSGFNMSGYIDGGDPGIDGLGVGSSSMGGESRPPSGLSTSFATIKVLSGIQGALPRTISERDSAAHTPLRLPHLSYLWGKPNRNIQVPKSWWTGAFAHLEGWADIFMWYNLFGSTLTGLNLIHPSRVHVFIRGGRKYFTLDGNATPEYTTDEILHIPGLSFDGVRGIPPVQAGMLAHRLSNLQNQWSSNFLRQGAGVSGIVSIEGDGDEDAIKQFYKDWDERHAGASNVGSVVVLSGAGKFERVTVPPEEAQLLESRMFSREEVLSCYAPGLPHHLLSWRSNTSNFGTGIEQQGRHLVEFVLLNRLELIEDAIDHNLLEPEMQFNFDVSRLLRGDLKTQADISVKMRQATTLSADEWRAQMHMPGRGIEDDYQSPKNMTRIGASSGEDLDAGEPAPRQQPPMRPPMQDPAALLLEARCNNAACRSTRGGRPGKLLAQNAGDVDLYCTDCKATTRIRRGQVLRDDLDIAHAVAERVNRRLILSGAK